MQSDIWIGDVVRAWKELEAKDLDLRRVIASILGFNYSPAVSVVAQPRQQVPPPASTLAVPAAGARVVSPVPMMPVEVPLQAIDRPTASRRASVPAWLQVEDSLEREQLAHLTTRPVHRPLFDPRWTRAIATAACATRSDDGPLDVPRLVEVLAHGRAVTELPRERAFSGHRGMQLLVDLGDNMVPFDRDVRHFVRQLRDVVGRDRTQPLYFADCPTFGSGVGSRSTWKTYVPPAPGTPIVLLTDLGMARGSAGRSRGTLDSWLEFLLLARAYDCPVIVFSPYPPDGWPPPLRRLVRAVHWDRSMTAAAAQRAARGAAGHG